MRKFCLLLIILYSTFSIATNNANANIDTLKQNHWVDSVLKSLSLREKIGQLFMVAAYSNRDTQHINEIALLVKEENIGGLCFFQGGPIRQALQTNYYQSLANVPLLISIDAEWGLGMRLDSTVSYPRQMMLGATGNPEFVYEMGVDIAKQMKRLGIHINFAPVVDINVNPLNPVIGSRSFGELKESVTANGLKYLAGLQDNGVLACAKHFPGHGDTDADSHLALPLVNHNHERLNTVELFPFKKLIEKNISGVMVAHLKIPAYEHDTSLASSISPNIINGVLRDSLNFKGLIYTDALNMKGVADFHQPVDLNFLALKAGNDILLCPDKVKESIDSLERRVISGQFPEDEIIKKCKKILQSKYKVGLSNYQPIDTLNLIKDLNTVSSELLRRKIIEGGITVLQNQNIIPIKKLDTLQIAYVEIGTKKGVTFNNQLNLYTQITSFSIDPESTKGKFDTLLTSLDNFNLVVVGYHSTDTRPAKSFGITPQASDFIMDLSSKKKAILDIFGNPFTLSKLTNTNSLAGLIISFDNQPLTQSLSAQLIFGGIGTNGKMPITIADKFSIHSGNKIDDKIRLKYSVPEELGMDSKYLYKIDSIALDAINNYYTPGMQVLAAKDGIVFYNKSFGKFTYLDSSIVEKNTLYDIASVTKVVATLPSLMNLYENKSINIDKTLGDYLQFEKGSDKIKIKIKDILLHQSGLQPWIPFYLSTLTTLVPNVVPTNQTLNSNYPFEFSNNLYLNKQIIPNPLFYQSNYSFEYPIKVAENLYAIEGIKDTIFNSINKSSLKDIGKYKYSDLGFIYLQRIVENTTSLSLDSLSDKLFYKKLGMNKTLFQPLRRFSILNIAPTENDIIFRKQIIRGYVHDPGAAMMGGIAGHAGVFSTANDLAKMMQMYLQNGNYGGEQYFNPETIKLFTSVPKNSNGNRRALGFDKPETQKDKQSPVCESASPQSFGHSGFTGTMIWADPEYNLVYIFLSNRVYPDALNNKLAEMNIRTKIQEIFYQAFKKSVK